MKDLIIGNHLLFARTGDLIDGVTVGPEAKPDTDPESNYTELPTVEDWEPRRTATRVVRRAPDPGKYEDRKTILLNKQMEHAFSLQEWTELTFAEMLLGGNKPVAGVFVPNERDEDVTGWFIVQSYDQDDNIINVMNIYGEARVEPYRFGERLDPYALIIRQLKSSLNTSEASNLS